MACQFVSRSICQLVSFSVCASWSLRACFSTFCFLSQFPLPRGITFQGDKSTSPVSKKILPLTSLPWVWQNSFLVIFLSSRRASAQAVTSKRYIRATSPVNKYSSGVKTDFRQKTGRSRAVYESIRKIATARATEISVPSQPSIQFFPLMAQNGPFFGL